MSESFWKIAGISQLKRKDGSSTITVPARLYSDEDILERGVDVRWFLDRVSNTVVVSKNHLDEDQYVFVDSLSFNEPDSARVIVPAKLFEDYRGEGGHGVTPIDLDGVEWSRSGWLCFAYHSGMAEGVKQSCYVLREDEFSERFGDDRLEGAPRFA